MAALAKDRIPEYAAASEAELCRALGYGSYRFRKLLANSGIREHKRKGYSGRWVKHYSLEDVMKAIAGDE